MVAGRLSEGVGLRVCEGEGEGRGQGQGRDEAKVRVAAEHGGSIAYAVHAVRMHAMRARCACHATTYHGRCPTSSTCLRTSTAAGHTAPHERPGAGRYSPQCGDLVAAGRLGPGACRPFVCLPASVPPPPRHGRAPFERAAPPAAPSASPSATASASAAPPLATLRHCLHPRLRCAGGCQTPTISSRMT